MLNKNSQVRLTVFTEGRLGAKASNANTKKDRKLASILDRKGKRFFNSEFYESPVQEVTQSCTLSSECVSFFTSEEGRTADIAPSAWKKMSKIQRLEANLQINADMLAGQNKAKFTYSVIE